MQKLIDLTGQRFGRLTVVSRAENGKNGRSMWLCLCECGNEKTIANYNIRNTKSCGCLRKELGSTKTYKHGESKTRLYNIWRGIKKRTCDKNQKDYEKYGKRGITICDTWEDDYITFRDWALTNGYQDNLQIDRIDNNNGYSPENCHWVSPMENSNNKRNNHFITHNGLTKTVTEWARIYGIKKLTVYNRILTLGWDEIRAITTPIKK